MDIRIQEHADLAPEGWTWCQRCDAMGLSCLSCGRLFVEGMVQLIAYDGPTATVPQGSVCHHCLSGDPDAMRERLRGQAARLREQAAFLEQAAAGPLSAPTPRAWWEAVVAAFPTQLPPYSIAELRWILDGLETDMEWAIMEGPDKFPLCVALRDLVWAEVNRRWAALVNPESAG
jgi:hypothetical protein